MFDLKPATSASSHSAPYLFVRSAAVAEQWAGMPGFVHELFLFKRSR